jgi:aminoglycoside phosphotransferase (APT) family kinase protein
MHSELSDAEGRLTRWMAEQLPAARDVRFEGLGRAEMGHSAETLLATVSWRDEEGDHREDVVARLRPPVPGLLEPYDLPLQFEVLRGLVPTRVRAPRPLWIESTGQVLGREFYLMERLPGTVYEEGIPPELTADPALARRMCESMVEQLAAIHSVDLHQTGLDAIGDGSRYLGRELAFWLGEMRRVQRGQLPGLERLAEVLRNEQPEQYPTATLVHGDPKAGNFAFEGGEVTAVFDWEMATIGDPLADIGWAEMLWDMPGSFTTVPGAMSAQEFVARWEALTGFQTQHRPWYRALQAFKMATIELLGSALVDAGHSDDPRFVEMAYGIRSATSLGLREFGIDEEIPSGPVLPRRERRLEVRNLQRPTLPRH